MHILEVCTQHILLIKMCDPKRLEMTLPVRVAYAVVTNDPWTSDPWKGLFLFMLCVSCGASPALLCVILALTSADWAACIWNVTRCCGRGRRDAGKPCACESLLGGDTYHFCLDFTGPCMTLPQWGTLHRANSSAVHAVSLHLCVYCVGCCLSGAALDLCSGCLAEWDCSLFLVWWSI